MAHLAQTTLSPSVLKGRSVPMVPNYLILLVLTVQRDQKVQSFHSPWVPMVHLDQSYQHLSVPKVLMDLYCQSLWGHLALKVH